MLISKANAKETPNPQAKALDAKGTLVARTVWSSLAAFATAKSTSPLVVPRKDKAKVPQARVSQDSFQVV